MCSGGSRAAVAGLLTLQGWDFREVPRVTPTSECSKLPAWPPSSSGAVGSGLGDRGARASQLAPAPRGRGYGGRGAGSGGVQRRRMREQLRVPARPLPGWRPPCAGRLLPLLPPTPALRPRGHGAPEVQPVVGPRSLAVLLLGLATARSPLTPPLCYLLNLPSLLGTPHEWYVTCHGLTGGPA